MKKDVYRRLARHLDDLPAGFPATEDGVELDILRRLFSPEDAELALHVQLIPETAPSISRRAGISEEEGGRRLEDMAGRGLIFRLARENRPPRYMANQFVIGIWEYQVNRLSPELIRDFNRYVPTLLDPEQWAKNPQLRTIPVGRSLNVELKALPYEDARQIVDSQTRWVEAPCICRQERRIEGEGCEKPEGSCLVFGAGADYYLRNGMGREITREEALDLLKAADRAGLVLQPSYSKKVVNICCCCGCCCQVLKNLKRFSRPAELFSSPFHAVFNEELCTDCGVCLSRCQMDALKKTNGGIELFSGACIGCGLCVSTCPSGALVLERKAPAQQPEIPENVIKAAVRRGRSRGKFGPIRLMKLWFRYQMEKYRSARRPGKEL